MARILIADDEEGIRSFLADALEGVGHDVETAVDGEEAWQLAQTSGFDVVISDLQMPRLDGMALLKNFADEQPEVEVIVLTAHGGVDSAVQAMKLGAFDFLQKPIGNLAEIRMLVSRAIERKGLRAHRKVASDPLRPALTWGAPAMAPVVDAISKVAATTATVLLTGESGSGKEVAARSIHSQSPRSEAPFIAVNCAALSDSLLESELFGHEKGAFTGADARHQGRIELAAGGTFFLDEVGELKLNLQAKLLRVLQERRFERVGGTQTIFADVRWIAATNRDLEKMVASGDFREDLYHRLAVFPVSLPSLRERRDDIPDLAKVLLKEVAKSVGRPDLVLSTAATEEITHREWPGNIRELRNTLERAAILAGSNRIDKVHLGETRSIATPAADVAVEPVVPLVDMERAAIARALRQFGGNRKQTAEALGLGVRTLYEKLKKYDLS